MAAPDHRQLLTTARADFLGGRSSALLDVPDHIVASWQRCAASGVSPDKVDSEFHRDLDLDSRLVRCAQPVIDELVERTDDMPLSVVLTDSHARILRRQDCSTTIGHVLDRLPFGQGFGYSESSVGTNGLGTVLETGTAVYVDGAEHFVENFYDFACAGAPIRSPVTGRIDGVLDVTCLSRYATPLMQSIVASAARRIEHNLLLDSRPTQQALFDAFTRADMRCRRSAVLGVGPNIVMANSALRAAIRAEDQEVLHDHVRYVMVRRSALSERLDLPSGVRVQLRGVRVSVGAEIAGMVCVVTVHHDEPARVAAPPATRRALAAPAASRTPAWCSAAGVVDAALRAGDPTLVLGEPGCGRYTLLTRLHGGVDPDAAVLALAADGAASTAELGETLRRGAGTTTLHVLRDVDRLPATTLAALAEILGAPGTGRVRLAATAQEAVSQEHPLQRLLPFFRVSTTLPPLRHRTADIPGLAADLLADLAPGREVGLAPDAVELLVRYGWPGNLVELRRVLAAALRRRPVGAILAQDLPALCQSAPSKVLRTIDSVERDAIVEALRDTGGNRVAAAALLGIARSTLYRKIRQYGVIA